MKIDIDESTQRPTPPTRSGRPSPRPGSVREEQAPENRGVESDVRPKAKPVGDSDGSDRERAWNLPYVELFRGCKLVLDVGCGSGRCLELLREQGSDAIGIDPDPVSVDRCLKRGLPARVLRPIELDRVQGPFDGIHANHILERLSGDDVARFLHLAFDSLYAGGLLVVRTPDWENSEISSGGFWLDLRNLRPYPLPLLEGLLREFGFEVVRRGRETGDGRDAFVVGRKHGAKPHPDLERLSCLSHARGRSGAPAVQWDENGTPAGSSLEGRKTQSGPIAVRLEGSQFVRSGSALANREIALALLKTGRVDLSIVPFEAHRFGTEEDSRYGRLAERFNRRLDREVELHVRHMRAPDFAPPREGLWVEMVSIASSKIPKAWVGPLSGGIDEIWTPSETCRRALVESGVPEDRVAVVPFGVNTELFKPGCPAMPLDTKRPFRLLFMGGTRWRSGIDCILDAYGRAFRRTDGVCLVVKETGDGADPSYVRRIRDLQADPGFPEILYLGEEFAEKDLPRLYAACHALVHPYRAEAFGLPVAEAMACGLPVILTRGGACDALAPEDLVYGVPARTVDVNGSETLAGPATILAPNLDILVNHLRDVAQHPEKAALRGRRLSDHARKNLGWEHSAAAAIERLTALRGRTPRRASDSAAASAQPSHVLAEPVTRLDSINGRRDISPLSPPTELRRGEPDRLVAKVATPRTSAPECRPTPSRDPSPAIETCEREAASPKPAAVESRIDEVRSQLERARRDIEMGKPASSSVVDRDTQTLAAAHETAARHYLERGRHADARFHLERLLRLRPADASALNSLGTIHYREGETKQALDYFERAAKAAPNHADAHYNLAMVHAASGLKVEAIGALERAAELGADDAELWNNLGVLHFEEGNIAAAEQHLHHALAKYPDYADALLNLALIDIRVGRTDRAREGLSHVLCIQPQNSDAKELLEKLPSTPGSADQDVGR